MCIFYWKGPTKPSAHLFKQITRRAYFLFNLLILGEFIQKETKNPRAALFNQFAQFIHFRSNRAHFKGFVLRIAYKNTENGPSKADAHETTKNRPKEGLGPKTPPAPQNPSSGPRAPLYRKSTIIY